MLEEDNPNAPAVPAEESAIFQTARGWYSEFLARELAARGQAEAALYLDHYLRLVSKEENPMRGGGGQLKAEVTQRLTECSVRLNARDGETISWYVDFLAQDGDTATDPEEVLKIALAAAQPPAEARLAVAEYDTSSGRVFYRVRWQHVHNGLPVEGDYLEVLVNGKHKRVFSLSKVWRKPHLEDVPCEK